MSGDDNRVGLEFYATTAAAVSEVSNLSVAIRENTTAATVAGSAQEQLGKDVALTRQRQLEATEAVRAAKQALDTHNQTVAAFGPKSAEAAASSEKLAAAEREAAKAATVAAGAVEKLAKEVKAVAAAEDGDLSPATKRAAAQVERMGVTAQKTAADLQRMELQQKRGSAGFDLMGFAGGKLMSVLGPAALGGTLIAVTGWLGEAAERTTQYETAVANLPFSLDGAKAATRGLISEQQLLAAASSASSLKVTTTSESFETLAAASVKLAAKLGQPADQLLNNLVTALGRGSTELLDNAGIVMKTAQAQDLYAKSIGKSVGSLTDEEKAVAFRTEAFKAIVKAADETTVAYDSNASAITRLKVSLGDKWDAIERGAVNAIGAMPAAVEGMAAQTERLAAAMTLTLTTVDAWSPAFKTGAGAVGEWSANLLLGADALEQVQRVIFDADNLKAFDAANEKERQKRDLLGEEAEFAERQAKALLEVEKANDKFLEAQALHSVTYGPQEAPKKKKTGKAKKKADVMDPGDVTIARVYDGREDTAVVAANAPEAAAAGTLEREQELFEAEMLRIERRGEILEVEGLREEEREAQRAHLQDQRMKRELEFAEFQVANARDAAARDKAITHREALEHKQRVALTQRAVEEEAKVLAKRQAQAAVVTGAVEKLGGAMADAAWQAAEGTEGAGRKALADFLKVTAKQMTIKALVETAMGAAAAAGVVTAGLAPGHFAAAAVAAGAAAAAGGAAIGLGAGADTGGARPSAGGAPGGTAANGAGPAMGGERERLERMEVPVSYAKAPAPTSVVIQIGTYVGSKNSAVGLANTVKRALDESRAQGQRP